MREAWDGRLCLLFSGGTDSTCAAALLARESREIHLLTFAEAETASDPLPVEKARALAAAFPSVRFRLLTADVEPLVRFYSRKGYLRALFQHGFFVLSNPGHSSLAWHTATALHCQREGIRRTADGLTRELMQFPGHMDFFIERMRSLYAGLGISYENPVREWPAPPDRQFTERLLVDRHGYFPFLERQDGRKTTGEYLFREGLAPAPDIKGSELDRKTQHSCYPFVLFNIFVFWIYLNLRTEAQYAEAMSRYLSAKFHLAEELLREADTGSPKDLLGRLRFREVPIHGG